MGMKKILLVVLVLLSVMSFAAEKVYLINLDKNLSIEDMVYDQQNLYYLSFDPSTVLTEVVVFDYNEKIFTTRAVYKEENYSNRIFVSDKYGNPRMQNFYGGQSNAGIFVDSKNIYVGISKDFYVFDKNLKLKAIFEDQKTLFLRVKSINGKIYVVQDTVISNYENNNLVPLYTDIPEVDLFSDIFIIDETVFIVGKKFGDKQNSIFKSNGNKFSKVFTPNDDYGVIRADFYNDSIILQGNKLIKLSRDFIEINNCENPNVQYYMPSENFYVENINNVFYKVPW